MNSERTCTQYRGKPIPVRLAAKDTGFSVDALHFFAEGVAWCVKRKTIIDLSCVQSARAHFP